MTPTPSDTANGSSTTRDQRSSTCDGPTRRSPPSSSTSATGSGATRNTRALAERHAGDPDYDDDTRAKTAFLDEIQPELRDWVRRGRS